MKKGDTRRREILQFIIDYREKNGYSPSVDDLSNQLLMVKSNVHHHLTKLEQLGMLEHDPKVARSWRPVVD